MLFLAIVIPAALQGILLSNKAGVLASRREAAARLADAKLTELIVTREWEQGNQSGDFGEDWPEYRWAFRSETWQPDAQLQQATVEVSFAVQQQIYSVQLSTLCIPTEN